jgi:hypothetical protein
MTLIGSGRIAINLSVPLVLEYEDVLSRPEFGFPPEKIRDVLDTTSAGLPITITFISFGVRF